MAMYENLIYEKLLRTEEKYKSLQITTQMHEKQEQAPNIFTYLVWIWHAFSFVFLSQMT